MEYLISIQDKYKAESNNKSWFSCLTDKNAETFNKESKMNVLHFILKLMQE